MEKVKFVLKRLKNIFLGLLLGVALTGIMLFILNKPDPTDSDLAFRPVPDHSGALEEVIIHYQPRAEKAVRETYEDLLRQLPSEVIVWVAVNRKEDFDNFSKQAENWSPSRELRPVVVDRPITTWSRDRYTLATRSDNGQNVLVIPEASDGRFRERANDWMVPWKLADQYGDSLTVQEVVMRFDGGDIIVTHDTLFADYNLFSKNAGHRFKDMEELGDFLFTTFGLKVLLLGPGSKDVPQHHIGMYLTPLGGNRILVGDPELAVELIGAESAHELNADLSEETMHRFQSPKKQLQELGYEVVSLPLLPMPSGVDFITYNNVVMETRNDVPQVYMPIYSEDNGDNAEASGQGNAALNTLDLEAAKIWKTQGFIVKPIRVSKVYRHHGSVRCLVNVVSRSKTTP